MVPTGRIRHHGVMQIEASSLFTTTTRTAKRFAFVFVVTTIAVVGSERFFWFWTPSIGQHFEGVAFYLIPVVVTLFVIDRFRVSNGWPLMLALPIYAYLTEGLLTPILYSGGPFVPFFPVWFAAWHGLLSIFVLVVSVRRWLLDGNWRALSIVSIGLGIFWGAWSSTLRLPENAWDEEMIADLGELVVLNPTAFARYAGTFTFILIAAHVLLSFLWPRSFTLGRRTRQLLGALVLLGVIGWTVVIPWALPMFVAYVWLQVWALRSHREAYEGPTLFEQLHGRFPFVRAAPLILVGVGATATYAALWELDPGEDILQVLMFGTIAAQTVVGGIVMFRSIRRARRASSALAKIAVEQAV